MNTELFIAHRLYGTGKGDKRISRPAVTIAQWGVATGIMVMIVSLCISVGFKQQIRDKIIGFGGHIQIRNYEAGDYGESPITMSNSDTDTLLRIPGIEKIQKFVQKPGLISINNEFEGILLKGIDDNYDTSFFEQYIAEGEIPRFSDTIASNKIVISKSTAKKLKVETGDKLNIYFMQNGIKARRMTVSGIYDTNFSEMDNLFALTDIYTTRRLNNWHEDQYTGIEISVDNYNRLDSIRDNALPDIAYIADKNRERVYVQTVEEMNPSLFAWLNVLDRTVWIILVLVLGIAGFTIISGILILILEKTELIGILKALGANDFSIRKIFLYYGTFIIGRGMLYGNIIGFALCILQQQFGIATLNPEMYYMESVPIAFTWLLLPLNIVMFIISAAMPVLPSMLISHIAPIKAIKFG